MTARPAQCGGLTALLGLAVIPLALVLWGCSAKVHVYTPGEGIALPAAGHGLALDDMAYSGELQRFIVPAGPSGKLYLIDPASNRITATVQAAPPAPHGSQGIGSAVYGLGFIFAADRTRQILVVIDAGSRRVVARHDLAAPPDLVRYAASQKEIWVTEPGAGQIEIFRIHPSAATVLSKRTTISVPGGPVSLAIDDERDMAYANLHTGTTAAIDLLQERITQRWPNTCRQSRGTALAEARGLLFVGCREGKVVSLDVAHGGTRIASMNVGKGIDNIAYDAVNNRLYVPAVAVRMLTVLSVAPSGHLEVAAKYRIGADAHCVVSNDSGQAYVCDPAHGRLLVIHYPPGGD